jgi:putative endonuclease
MGRYKGGSVYIMTNRSNTVLYTGVTSNLEQRVWRHKNAYYPKSFTCRYKCYKLAFYKDFPSIIEAITEEKRIKGGSRAAKMLMIKTMNPSFNDLSENFGTDNC